MPASAWPWSARFTLFPTPSLNADYGGKAYADFKQMLDAARDGKFAFPAINISSSESLNAALRGFAEAKSDGIIQVSTGGGQHASGSKVKDMVLEWPDDHKNPTVFLTAKELDEAGARNRLFDELPGELHGHGPHGHAGR